MLLVRIPNRIPKRPKGGTITTILKKLDLVGFGLFAPAAIQVLLALEWGGTRYPWHSSKIIGLFCGSGATLFVFLLWQWHMDDGAMIPFSAIRQKIVWSSCLVMLFFFGSVMASVYYLPIWFQSVKGVSPITSGVWLLPTMLPQMLFAVISGVSGKSADHVKYYWADTSKLANLAIICLGSLPVVVSCRLAQVSSPLSPQRLRLANG